MPGRNDWSAGFTKSAQKTKFVRKRDLKMKDSEIKKEQHIYKAMCEGICRHCIEKLQWRFQYDKYKPLKNVGNCKKCKQKVITKAYRNYCDKCAAAENVCPSCLVNVEEANKPIPENTKTAIKLAKANKKAEGGKNGAGGEDGDSDVDFEDSDVDMDEDGQEPVKPKAGKSVGAQSGAKTETAVEGQGEEEEEGEDMEDDEEEEEGEGEEDEPDSEAEDMDEEDDN